MLTDKQISEMRKDKIYRRSNGFYTCWKYARDIVKSGKGYISLSYSFKGGFSISIVITKILWGILRYYYITHEIAVMRRCFIESIVHIYQDSNIIEHILHQRYIWMESNEEKIRLLHKICIDYLEDADNRLCICSHSSLDDEEASRRIIEELVPKVDELFDKEIQMIKKKDFMHCAYSMCFENKEFSDRLVEKSVEALLSGNLTDGRINDGTASDND